MDIVITTIIRIIRLISESLPDFVVQRKLRLIPKIINVTNIFIFSH